MMREQDRAEVWAALAIGAIVGVGTALLVRARQEDEGRVLQVIRPLRKRTSQTAERLADGAGDLVQAARKAGARSAKRLRRARPMETAVDALDDLGDRAREIVESTRRELEKAARDSVKEARKAARRAARRVGR